MCIPVTYLPRLLSRLTEIRQTADAISRFFAVLQWCVAWMQWNVSVDDVSSSSATITSDYVASANDVYRSRPICERNDCGPGDPGDPDDTRYESNTVYVCHIKLCIYYRIVREQNIPKRHVLVPLKINLSLVRHLLALGLLYSSSASSMRLPIFTAISERDPIWSYFFPKHISYISVKNSVSCDELDFYIPSVCTLSLSACLSNAGIMSMRLKQSSYDHGVFNADSPMTLVSSRLTSPRNSKGNIGSEGAKWERGSKNRQLVAVSQKRCKIGP